MPDLAVRAAACRVRAVTRPASARASGRTSKIRANISASAAEVSSRSAAMSPAALASAGSVRAAGDLFESFLRGAGVQGHREQGLCLTEVLQFPGQACPFF